MGSIEDVGSATAVDLEIEEEVVGLEEGNKEGVGVALGSEVDVGSEKVDVEKRDAASGAILSEAVLAAVVRWI